MPRKWFAWSVIALAVPFLLLTGCKKDEPATPAPPPEVEVEAPEEPSTDIEEPAEPDTSDMQEQDPLASEDLQEVNRAAEEMGYSPNVYFDFDKSDLRSEAREQLARNAEFLKEHPNLGVTVEGHCDERGTNEYNLALGQRRATTAKDYLMSLGVAADRLKTISYGEERPVCTESTEGCWQRNRRAHMPITSN